MEIRVDWDNDRHHAIRIQKPFDGLQVSIALSAIARIIHFDENLK